MQRTLRTQNGTIVLPPRLRRAWRGAALRIREYADRIAVEGPAARREKIDLKAWERAAGVLKRKRIPNPVTWQRMIRREWERRLP